MPRFDGTGPQGQGPGTGRRKGKCQTDDFFNEMNRYREQPKDQGFFGFFKGLGRSKGQGAGLGGGMGRGMGRGRRKR